ncbi:MAG: YraN family protein [Armatimonadota bacterium]
MDRRTWSSRLSAVLVYLRRLMPWDPHWTARPGERRHTVSSDKERGLQARRAENAVAFRLFWQGHRILARNLRNREGELDVVARKGRRLVFVEVRSYRQGTARPSGRLGLAKRRRLLRAVERFLSRRPALAELDRVIQIAEVCFDDRGRVVDIGFLAVDYSDLRALRP